MLHHQCEEMGATEFFYQTGTFTMTNILELLELRHGYYQIVSIFKIVSTEPVTKLTSFPLKFMLPILGGGHFTVGKTKS